MRVERWTPWALLALAAAAAVAPPAAAGETVRLTEEAELLLHVRPVLVVDGQSGTLARKQFVVDPDRGGTLALELQWPHPPATSRLVLEARGRPGPPDAEHALSLDARLTLPSGRASRTSRRLRLREGATSLVEVYRSGGEGLTLALSVERRVRRLAVAGRTVGDPVLFRLDVDRVRGERSLSLETNHLSTFVGEGVEYSFERGEGESAEYVRLLLTPVRRAGDLVEITVRVTGSLPGEKARVLLSRAETLFTSRHATSSLTVASGAPAEGYRFRITPDF